MVELDSKLPTVRYLEVHMKNLLCCLSNLTLEHIIGLVRIVLIWNTKYWRTMKTNQLESSQESHSATYCLKVHKNENFFGFDFEFCTISLLVMSKY